jgi:dipeptidyl aminopeptidase/acylaminoacyl peptidase
MDEGRPPEPAAEPGPVEGTDARAETHPEASAETVEPANAGDDPPDVDTEEVALEPRGPSRGLIAIALVLVAALVVFAIVGGRIVTPSDAVQQTAAEARLAVTDGGGKLYTMDANGGSVTDYALPGIQFGFPGWSPDGSQIAVTGNDADDEIRLYVFDARDGADAEPTIVYDEPEHPPFYIYWSLDGRQIAFLTTEPDGIALRLVPADGSAQASVVRQGAPLYWDWAGNDHLVAHIGSSGEGSFLGEVDLQGASTEDVALEPGFFRSPAVSRDGAYRAYVTTGQDTTGIVTLESADGSTRREVPVFGVAAVSFDPTGQTLAYVGSEQPRDHEIAFPLGPLRLLDPASGQSRTLLGGDVVAFFWSPDGTTIAALMLQPPQDQVVGDSGAHLASTRGGPPGDGEPLPPDQGVPLTLVFVDVASGSIRAQRATEVTGRFVNNILPYYDQYALSHRLWAPDSSALALPLDADGDDQLFVIPADGSEVTPLAGAELGFWQP